MKVLILSDYLYGGHGTASKYIKEAIEKKYPEPNSESITAMGKRDQHIETIIEPVFDKVFPEITKEWMRVYWDTFLNRPEELEKVYKETGPEDYRTPTPYRETHKKLSKDLLVLIKEHEPSVVVVPNPTILHMAANLKGEADGIKVPVIGVVTDYTSNSNWLNDHIDALIVPNEAIKKEIVETLRNLNLKDFICKDPERLPRISPDSIFPYGMPTGEEFFKEKPSRNEIHSGLGLEDKKTVLIMAGSLGVGNVPAIFKSLLDCPDDFQLIAVAGKNEDLKSTLKDILSRSSSEKNVEIFGHTDKIAELMRASDCVITKPGGLTTAEALAAGCPMIIAERTVIQERENAEFLLRHGAAKKIDICSDLQSLTQLLSDINELKAMKKAAKSLSNRESGGMIARLIGSLGKKYEMEREKLKREPIKPELIKSEPTVKSHISIEL